MMQEVRLLRLPFSTRPETECGGEVWPLARRNQPLTRRSQLGIWWGGVGDFTHVTTTFEAMQEKPGK